MVHSMRRVVVTGLGMLSPLGVGVDVNWARITAGESGIGNITGFDASDLTSRIAGEVPRGDADDQFNADRYIAPKEQKKMDNFIHFAMGAADEAIADSGYVPKDDEARDRAGVLIGSGIGGLNEIYQTSIVMHERGARRVSPFFIPRCLINLASGQVSIKHGLRGPNHSVVTACATGTHAIGDAARMIMLDDADVMIAGGTEAAVCRLGVGGFCAMRALSTSYNDTPEKGSRPFDKGRDGFVIGEGAGVLVLEEYEHAKARGAKIYGEVSGYGLSGDAYHMSAPASDGNGGFRAMKAAMKKAGVNPEDIDYVNAHGTSTPLGDEIEVGAVKRLLGDAVSSVMMSSTKSAIGHLLGAAGAVEAIYCLKAMETGIVPPTLNLDDVSDACVGIDLVPHKAKEKEVNIALSNSFGFGGTNASVVLKKV